tara:strand:+ start:1659 stop:2282 length:624 start_codon:yes stop_codon:yes gene_type:complete
MKQKVFNLENKPVEEIEIKDVVFCSKIFPDVIHNYVRYQMLKSREGNHKTKTRSEVRGKSKKPFKQKGTGSARQGSSKGPHFRGGGVAFGPVVRDHSIKLNKKEKKLALKCALSEKFKNKEIIIINDLKLDSHKTKLFNKQINKFDFKSAIFIQPSKEIDKNFVLASSNIPKINCLTVDGLNIKDMLNHEKIFISKKAIQKIEEKLS